MLPSGCPSFGVFVELKLSKLFVVFQPPTQEQIQLDIKIEKTKQEISKLVAEVGLLLLLYLF